METERQARLESDRQECRRTGSCKGSQIWRQIGRQDYRRTDKHADVQPGIKVDRFGDRETGNITDGQTGMQTYIQADR